MKRSLCMAIFLICGLGIFGLGGTAYGQTTDAEIAKEGKFLNKMNQAILAGDMDAAFKNAEKLMGKEAHMQTVLHHSFRLKRCDIAKKAYLQMAAVLRTINKVSLSQHCP